MMFSGYVKNNDSLIPVIDRFNADLITGNWDGRTGGLIKYDHLQYFAIVEDDTSKIISFLIYQDSPMMKRIEICGGWTDAAHRRQGLYNRLFNHLVTIAKASDYQSIIGATHKDNEVMVLIMKSQKREVTGTSPQMGRDFISTKLNLKEDA